MGGKGVDTFGWHLLRNYFLALLILLPLGLFALLAPSLQRSHPRLLLRIGWACVAVVVVGAAWEGVEGLMNGRWSDRFLLHLLSAILLPFAVWSKSRSLAHGRQQSEPGEENRTTTLR